MLAKPDTRRPTTLGFAPLPAWSLAPHTTDVGANTAAMWADRVEAIATRLLEADDALSDPRWLHHGVRPGLGHGPRLFMEDHSEIQMSPPDTHTLEYRLAWLARTADVVALAERRVPAFEQYVAQHHGLGRPRYVRPARGTHGSLPRRCADDQTAFESVLELAAMGDFSVVPYIATRSAWMLAERIATVSGRVVRVGGAPPDLVTRVNNKLWFAQRVRELIGPDAIAVTHVASDDRELTSHLEILASTAERIVVKVPAGSGGRGIVACHATTIVPGRAADTAQMVCRRLAAGGWDGAFPLVVGVWDAPLVASPSVQVWVPHAQDGFPIIEAIFDQLLDGARFIGATESTLPTGVRDRLSREAMGLALLLQRLGYFGRCGFDAVLVGESVDEAQVHWLECNGRWGSVSTALSALRRLVGDRRDRAFAVVQSELALSRSRSFEEVLGLLAADLLHNRDDGTGAIILSPRRVMTATGLNLAVVEDSSDAAQRTAERILDRLAH